MQELQAIAKQFNVDEGALACLQQFLVDNIGKDPQTFVSATPEQRSQIIKQGVKAWHAHSVRLLSELHEGKTEAAREARNQIASQVWHAARARNAS